MPVWRGKLGTAWIWRAEKASTNPTAATTANATNFIFRSNITS